MGEYRHLSRPYVDSMATCMRSGVALLVLLLSACSMPRPADAVRDQGEAPVIEVSNGRSRFELTAWSACIIHASGGSCWDGAPPADPVDVGVVVDRVQVTPEHRGWRWQVMVRQVSAHPKPEVGTGQELAVEHSSDRRNATFSMPPGGPYYVDLMGRGPDGDASYTFVASGS